MARHKGSKLSENHRKNLSKAHTGIKLSENHKKSISKGNLGKTKLIRTENHRKNLSVANTGKVGNKAMLGKHHTKEAKSKIKANNIGKIRTEETVDRISKAKSKLISEGKFHPLSNFEHGYYLSSKTDELEYYASSYELNYMLKLDSKTDVKTWTKKHSIFVKYEFEGRIHRYVPDFKVEYIDGSISIEEVKGWLEDVDLCKFLAIEKYCKEKGWRFQVR